MPTPSIYHRAATRLGKWVWAWVLAAWLIGMASFRLLASTHPSVAVLSLGLVVCFWWALAATVVFQRRRSEWFGPVLAGIFDVGIVATAAAAAWLALELLP